jgi:hypothetical protein
LIVEGESVDVDARVRHVRIVESTGSKTAEAREAPRYLIGLEFLSPPESVLRSIEHLEES